MVVKWGSLPYQISPKSPWDISIWQEHIGAKLKEDNEPVREYLSNEHLSKEGRSMKCDGCPIGEECDDQPCSHERKGACHLTPVDFRIIRAMIAGEWKCETCLSQTSCIGVKFGVDRPCAWWQPRKELSEMSSD